jgi:hypothetical protein
LKRKRVTGIPWEELEMKNLDAKQEMVVSDALDDIRARNAKHEHIGKDGGEVSDRKESLDKERERYRT